MSGYAILTDSNCDLPAFLLEQYDIRTVPLYAELDGMLIPADTKLDLHAFYDRLRAGGTVRTSAPSQEDFAMAMRECAREGKDVLCICFSSALSGTYNAARLAAEEAAEEFPQRRFRTVDSLCASLGQGMLAWKCARMREAWTDVDEAAERIEAEKLRVCHWFTVDDLMYLKRGGRIPAAAAVLGSVLNVKPILHMNAQGLLEPVTKVRGRIASLKALVERMRESAVSPEEQTVFISHGDCEKDAHMLAGMLKEKLRVREAVIHTVGPVIGAHAGPGTLALFLTGTVR